MNDDFPEPRRLHADDLQLLNEINRKLDLLIGAVTNMDLYDRIIAAVAAIKVQDVAALETHVAAIDTHLQQLDTSDTDEETRIGAIEAGLNKIADAVNPVPTPTPTPTPAPGA